MTFGRKVRNGSLPVFAVDTEEEAKALIVLTCPTNVRGEYIAPELAQEQTLENLALFSDRLQRGHDLLVKNWHCHCSHQPEKKR